MSRNGWYFASIFFFLHIVIADRMENPMKQNLDLNGQENSTLKMLFHFILFFFKSFIFLIYVWLSGWFEQGDPTPSNGRRNILTANKQDIKQGIWNNKVKEMCKNYHIICRF